MVLLRVLLVYGIAHPVLITSSHMEPTLQRFDRVVLSPILGFITRRGIQGDTPEKVRGQIVQVSIHDLPVLQNILNEMLYAVSLGLYRLDHPETMLRRIIAFEGETITINKHRATIRHEKDDVPVSEFALISTSYDTVWEETPLEGIELPFLGTLSETTVPEGHVFVLADNRLQGIDSRYWGGISLDSIRSRVIVRYWPFPRRELF